MGYGVYDSDNYKHDSHWQFGSFLAFVFLILFLVFAVKACKEEVKKPDELYKTTPIYSLQLTQSTSGRFILGVGDVGTYVVYYAYVKDEDGYYELEKFSGNIKIRIGNDIEPCVQYWYSHKYGSTQIVICIPEDSEELKFDPNMR